MIKINEYEGSSLYDSANADKIYQNSLRVAQRFCFTYGVVWLTTAIDPFNAALFICLATAIREYTEKFFATHFDAPLYQMFTAMTFFWGAKFVGAIFGCSLTSFEAISALFVTIIAAYLVHPSYVMATEIVKA